MKNRKKTSSNKKPFAKLTWLFFILLGSALFIVNAQNRQDIRSRGGVNSVTVQCSQYPTVDVAFSFTNTETYAVNLVVKLSNDPGGNSAEVANIPPGETRNGILDSQKPSLSKSSVVFTWTPSELNNSQPPKSTTQAINGMTCDFASLTATLPADPGLSDPDGSSTPDLPDSPDTDDPDSPDSSLDDIPTPTFTCLGACITNMPDMEIPEGESATELSPIPSAPSNTGQPADTGGNFFLFLLQLIILLLEFIFG